MYLTKKNCFSFLILLSLIIIFLYYYYLDDEVDEIIVNENIDPILDPPKSNYKIEYTNTPDLRGITNTYQFNNRSEEGGSKAFSNNYKLDDSNLKNNEVNFVNPSTYTKLPTTLNDLKK